jgi:hypothetical protein
MNVNRAEGPRVATTPTAYGHCRSAEHVPADVCYRRNARTAYDATNAFRWDWGRDWLVAAAAEDASS